MYQIQFPDPAGDTALPRPPALRGPASKGRRWTRPTTSRPQLSYISGFAPDLDGPLTRFSRSRHFWSRISHKRRVLGTKLLKNTNRKPYTIWRLTPISRSWHFSTLNISETIRDRAYRMRIGSRIRSITWWHFQWPWRTPNPVFKVTAFLKSNIMISQKRRVLGTKLLKNTNRKPYVHNLSNCATFNDLEWPLTPISRSRHFWSGIS